MFGAAHHTDVDLGKREGGALGCHDQITRRCQGQSGAHGHSVDSCDHRQRAIVDRPERFTDRKHALTGVFVWNSVRSLPPQKCLPAPVKTIARASGRYSSVWVKNHLISAYISRVTALTG